MSLRCRTRLMETHGLGTGVTFMSVPRGKCNYSSPTDGLGYIIHTYSSYLCFLTEAGSGFTCPGGKKHACSQQALDEPRWLCSRPLFHRKEQTNLCHPVGTAHQTPREREREIIKHREREREREGEGEGETHTHTQRGAPLYPCRGGRTGKHTT